MQRYSLKHIKSLSKFNFHGLELRAKGVEKELVTTFIYNPEDLFLHEYPLKIVTCGITYPDINYQIERINSKIYVIEYILSGRGYLEINDKKFKVKKGDVYLIEPNTKHRYYADKDEPFKKLWVNFYSHTYGDILKSFKMNGIYYFPKVNIENYFYQIFLLENVSLYSEDISYLAYEIIFQMTLKIKQSMIIEHKYKNLDLARQIRQFIDTNIQSNIKLNSIATKLKISVPTLINKFKECYKITPKKYILEKKIKTACVLLLDSNKKINEIASLLCFSDAYNFSHAFKKIIGISPNEYREENIGRFKKEVFDL